MKAIYIHFVRLFQIIGPVVLSLLVQSCKKLDTLPAGSSEFVEIMNHDAVSLELKRSKARNGDLRNPTGYVFNSSITLQEIWPLITDIAINGQQQWVDIMLFGETAKVIRIDFPLSDNNQINWQDGLTRYLELPSKEEAFGVDPATNIKYIRLSVINGVIMLGNDIVSMNQVTSKIAELQPSMVRVAVGINVLLGHEKLSDIFNLLYIVQSAGCKFSIFYNEQ